ncbi:hypothetical protein BC30090_3281 [Bacillus cereus]|nr:hypothetical protein CON32_04820 [Bacillus cereus]BCD24384.1 hypothetical protein BC30090_3281 [Bacillus cereus]
MLQNDTILTLQYEWEEQMMENEKSNEGSLKKVQDLITAIKSTYYFSSLLTMSETEFDEWFEENKLLVLTYNAKSDLHSFEESLENYVQVPSVSDENITSGLLHFGFNGEILVAMLKWILEKGAPVVVQEGVKKILEWVSSKGQTQENQELSTGPSSLGGRNQESDMDVLKNFADENPEFLMRNVEVFGSVKIGIGDVYMQFGEPKTELQRSQKN